jgi:hypothetical protein
MIYFPDNNIVIITPPHTASGNMHRGLCVEKHGGVWVMGPDPFDEDSVNHHYAKLPSSWGKFDAWGDPAKPYVVCRNPYDRLVGLFLHYEWAEDRGIGDKRYLCWEEFVYGINDLHYFFHKTISNFLKAAGLEDYETIIYENLEEDLSRILGQEVSLPPRYHDPIIFEEWYYDKNLLRHVNEYWAKDDCELFSYPIKLIPPMFTSKNSV